MSSKLAKYTMNLLISIDQLGNTLLAGDPDETISSRVGKAAATNRRLAVIGAKILGWFDRNHAADAIDLSEGADELWRWRKIVGDIADKATKD